MAMADNREKGKKTKSRIKVTQKDIWTDEEIDMLNIFSSETIQNSLEAARSPRDKRHLSRGEFFKIASATSQIQIAKTRNRLARDRYPSVEAIKYRNKAIFFLTSKAFRITLS